MAPARLRPTARRYGGATAEERTAERSSRFLEAGLELMGTRGIAGTTVRGLAEESGLAARYFYESFPTLDDLIVAVFDRLTEEAATRAIAAVAATAGTDDDARTRAVLAEMVDLSLEDPRVGRVLFVESIASPVLAPRVRAESRRFAGMVAATASAGDPEAATDNLPAELQVAAQFLLGGVAHTLRAAIQGDLTASRDQIVDILVGLFSAVGRLRPQPTN